MSERGRRTLAGPNFSTVSASKVLVLALELLESRAGNL
jgi:hypothetical protein